MNLVTGKNIVFILSSPRSGSTMLRLTLGKFPAIISLPETHFFTFQNHHRKISPETESGRKSIAEKWATFHTVKRMELDGKKLGEKFIKEGRSWKDLFEFTIDAYLELRGIVPGAEFLVVEKTPAHVFYQDQIIKMYPDSKIIYLIRDPRDVVASLKHCTWSTSNVFTNAKVWRNATNAIQTGPGRFLVNYARLVTEPEQSLAEMAEFLGFEYQKEVIFKELDNVPAPKMASSKNAFKPISDKHIGTWKEKLSGIDRDRDIIEAVCGKEMKKYGFEPLGVVRDKRFYRAMLMWKFSHLMSVMFRI